MIIIWAIAHTNGRGGGKRFPMSSVSWRDFRASLARNLNRRCSRLERARRSFRLIRSPLFAYGDAPLGRRSARSPTALQAECPDPCHRQTKIRITRKGFPDFCVEVAGFEPAAFWSRTKRATKLRYTSMHEPMRGLEPLTC